MFCIPGCLGSKLLLLNLHPQRKDEVCAVLLIFPYIPRLYMLRLSVLGEISWCNAVLLYPTPMGRGIGVETFLDVSPPPSVNELK